MRGRRMSRAKHVKKDSYGAATVVLLLLLAAAFIYAFKSLGFYDMIFQPAATAGTQTPAVTASASAAGSSATAQETSSVLSGDKITEEIKMGSVTLYGVQLGVFTELSNAQATADKFKAEGSAGYIMKEDALYRVIDSVYYNENDAKTVRDAYRAGSSPDACVIRVQASGVNWKVNATREQIDSIRGAMSAIQSQIVVLINAQKTAVQDQGTADTWKTTAGNTAKVFADARDAMMAAIGPTNSDIIMKLNECLSDGSERLTTLSQLESSNVAGVESALKYSIIDILLDLQNKIMG
jgi:hypothetical protein